MLQQSASSSTTTTTTMLNSTPSNPSQTHTLSSSPTSPSSPQSTNHPLHSAQSSTMTVRFMARDVRQTITTVQPQSLLLTNSRVKVVVREGHNGGSGSWQEKVDANRNHANDEMIILIVNNILLYLEMGMVDGKR